MKDKHGKLGRLFRSHGDGALDPSHFAKIGSNVIFEKDIFVFHPEHIELGSNVYVGHRAYLKAYYKNKMVIGNNVWIGQNAYLHAGGGITIEDGVGIGPYVKILTLEHKEGDREIPIIYLDQNYSPVTISYGVDIGIGAIVLPGVIIGRNSIIGAGAVVTKDIPPFSVAAGIPARIIRQR